jgi:hypothetical protein
MKLFCHVLSLTLPLVIAALLLLFAMFTEWWSFDDHTQARKSFVHDKNNKHFIRQQIRHKFTRLDGLFGMCYDYKSIDVIEPLKMSNIMQNQTGNKCESNQCENNANCVCCKSKPDCCFSIEKRCDLMLDCEDQSDEQAIECSGTIVLNGYETQWFDELNGCYRVKYNYLQVLKDMFKTGAKAESVYTNKRLHKRNEQADTANYDEPNDNMTEDYAYESLSVDQNASQTIPSTITPTTTTTTTIASIATTTVDKLVDVDRSTDYKPNGSLEIPGDAMPVNVTALNMQTTIIATLTSTSTQSTTSAIPTSSSTIVTSTVALVVPAQSDSSLDDQEPLVPNQNADRVDEKDEVVDHVKDHGHVDNGATVQPTLAPTQTTSTSFDIKQTPRRKPTTSPYAQFESKILKMNLFLLLNMLLCLLFTVLCLFTIIFVKCCNYRTDSTERDKYEYYDNVHNYKYTFRNRKEVGNRNDNDDDDDDEVDSTGKLSCCKCTYILCPFIFYSIFTFMAFISSLISIFAHLYKLYLLKNHYLTMDLYQLNTWLSNLFRFGLSFYSLIAACCIYFLTFILSTCITCQIRSSPQWRSRYSDVYEVLQMNDVNVGPKPKFKSQTEVKLKSKKIVKA